LGGLGHVRAPEKLEGDVAQAGPADAGEAIEAAEDAEGLLDGPADLVLDLLGRRARYWWTVSVG
jgi:hypothetical protein